MKKLLPLLLIAAACQTTKDVQTVASIEILDSGLEQIIATDAKAEVIAEGYDWSEGPVWVESEKMLLFTDVPANIVYKWTEANGASVYLNPSGFTGSITRSKEPGANGLIIDDQGRLVLCQHGDRRIAYMNAALANPETKYGTIVGNFRGKKFNSPNDIVQGKNRNMYFTDPPYGLGNKDETDPEKEIPFQGVYRVTPDEEVKLLIDSISRPNGIGLSPDNKYLYIASSDPKKARWYQYELSDTGVVAGKVFFDATTEVAKSPGLPDGLKVSSKGHLFASGPGGIFIFGADGKVLGKIKLEAPAANVALTPDEKWLFITNDNQVLRVPLK